MILLVFLNAIMRYVFRSGILVSEEVSRFLFIWIVYSGVIAAYIKGEHIAVTLVIDKLKGTPKKLFMIIKYLVILGTTIVIFLGGISFTKTSNYPSLATRINFSFITVSLAIAGGAMLVITVINIFKYLKGNEEK